MSREEWLTGLKKDDKVAIRRDGLGENRYLIGYVLHITPTRKRLDVRIPEYDQTWELDKDGFTKRSKGSWTARQFIQPVTDEVLLVNKTVALRRKLEGLLLTDRNRLVDLTLDQMERIVAVVLEENRHGEEAAKNT